MSTLRAQLSHAAGPEEPPVDVDALRRCADIRRQRRRAALAGLAAIGLLALGSFMWTSDAGGTADQQLTAGNGTDDTTGSSTIPEATTVTTSSTSPETTTTTTPSTTEPITATTMPVTTTTAPVTVTTMPATTVRTTPTTAPVTVSPPTPTSPSADDHHVAGGYRGEGRLFEPSTGSCAELAHRLDAEFVLDTGEDWRYHADYCGTVRGTLWSGAGTFTFTTPTGDHVTGTFADQAILPSKGVPYDLIITGGTGRWAGSTGTCHLTNHMRMLPSGMQEQAGDFTCDLQL